MKSDPPADGRSNNDPLMSGAGHDGKDAMIGGIQTQFPSSCFHRVGDPDAHDSAVFFETERSATSVVNPGSWGLLDDLPDELWYVPVSQQLADGVDLAILAPVVIGRAPRYRAHA